MIVTERLFVLTLHGGLQPTDEICCDYSLKNTQSVPASECLFGGVAFVSGTINVEDDVDAPQTILGEWLEDNCEHRFELIIGRFLTCDFRLVFEDEADASLFYLTFK